jgi:hypothetical protein
MIALGCHGQSAMADPLNASTLNNAGCCENFALDDAGLQASHVNNYLLKKSAEHSKPPPNLLTLPGMLQNVLEHMKTTNI